jgi:hypothetical protein
MRKISRVFIKTRLGSDEYCVIKRGNAYWVELTDSMEPGGRVTDYHESAEAAVKDFEQGTALPWEEVNDNGLPPSEFKLPVMPIEEFLLREAAGEAIAKKIEQEMLDAKDVVSMKAFNDAIRLCARIARGLA